MRGLHEDGNHDPRSPLSSCSERLSSSNTFDFEVAAGSMNTPPPESRGARPPNTYPECATTNAAAKQSSQRLATLMYILTWPMLARDARCESRARGESQPAALPLFGGGRARTTLFIRVSRARAASSGSGAWLLLYPSPPPPLTATTAIAVPFRPLASYSSLLPRDRPR